MKPELSTAGRACVVCEKLFAPYHKATKYCSPLCRNKAYSVAQPRPETFVNQDVKHGTIGAISELVAASYLMGKGWMVFRALSPSCFCDLVAYKDGEKMFIEVRTARRRNENRYFCKSFAEGVTHMAIVEPLETPKVEIIPV